MNQFLVGILDWPPEPDERISHWYCRLAKDKERQGKMLQDKLQDLKKRRNNSRATPNHTQDIEVIEDLETYWAIISWRHPSWIQSACPVMGMFILSDNHGGVLFVKGCTYRHFVQKTFTFRFFGWHYDEVRLELFARAFWTELSTGSQFRQCVAHLDIYI